MMVIGSRYNLNLKVSDLRSNIRINNNVVLSVFFKKCLGIYLDQRLDFDAHIEDEIIENLYISTHISVYLYVLSSCMLVCVPFCYIYLNILIYLLQ